MLSRVLQALQAKGADIAKLAAAANVKGSDFLSADPDLDLDLPSVEDWLSSNGFAAVPS